MPPISLLGGLKNLAKPKASGAPGADKFAIRLTLSDDLMVNLDEGPITLEVAQAAAAQIKQNLMSGLGPDGSPLPGISGSTEEWRKREAAQGSRGGMAHPRYTNTGFRSRAAKNYARDYSLRGLYQFTPRAGGPRGVVSGLLAASFSARASKDGRSATIYVAARRGRARTGESLSALESVFRGGFRLSMDQSLIKSSVAGATRKTIGTATAMKQLIGEFKKLLAQVNRLEAALDD